MTDLEKQLEAAKEEIRVLRESRDKMSQALSIMGHDLRSPLQTIGGFAYCMVDEDSREERQELYKIIEDGVQQMATLINDVVNTTRLESGTMKFNIASYSALSIIGSVADAHQPIFSTLPSELTVEVSGDDVIIAADSIRLKEILNNFLSNAAKYTDSGTVTLSIQMRDGGCQFNVTDTGVGFDPSNCEKVFNKHEMLSSSRQGSGLGLYICRQLARGMGGEVGCTSEPGKGSNFWVWMPGA